MNRIKTPQDSMVTTTHLVLPQDTNALGTIFGGTIMSWMDITAGIAAARHAQFVVVTASVEGLHFLAPIQLGSIVEIKAMVNFVATKSLEVGVKVFAENPLRNEKNHTASAYFTFVALDQDGKPTTISKLHPQNEVDIRRYEEGRLRHETQRIVAQKLKRKYHQST